MSSFKAHRELFETLDRHLFEEKPKLGRWLSWPIVRHYLWLQLFYADVSTSKTRQIITRLQTVIQSLPGVCMAFFHNLSTHLFKRGVAPIAVVLSPRDVHYADGVVRNFQFDDWLSRKPANLGLMEVRLFWSLKSQIKRTYIDALPRTLLAQALVRLVAMLPIIKKATVTLSDTTRKITEAHQISAPEKLFRKFLALFWINKWLFKLFLKWHRIRLLIVVDACSTMPEVAAAKELNIPVLEVQHGVFGLDDPGYNWPQYYRLLRDVMPLPDYFLAYGDTWKKLILTNRFWQPEEVQVVGMPTIERYQNMSIAQPALTCIHILFATQKAMREHAFTFWLSCLQKAKEMKIPLMLTIKIHPGEALTQDYYQPLVTVFPENVRIISPATMIYDLILTHHLVVSYHSTTLIEAVALGIPALSLCVDSNTRGFAEISLIPEIETVMPHVDTVEDFFALLLMCLQHGNYYTEWKNKTKKFGRDIFQLNFFERMDQVVQKVLMK